jgi:hypothetical protein
MNFLALGARTLKVAEKARSKACMETFQAEVNGVIYGGPTPDEAYQQAVDNEYARMEKAFDIGLTYYDMANVRLKRTSDDGRWYMLTTRPPHDCNWNRYLHSVKTFINKYSPQWCEWEYCFEQIGTSTETMGKGFHCHMLFNTKKQNYYPSHILRDAKTNFPYIAANCIQVDSIVNLEKTKQYIRGHKKQEKLESVSFNTPWRVSKNLKDLYSNNSPIESGQVQPLSLM